ncbi:hypothetical protein B0T16DRAFT_457282 [Cercophora newfieldiana]|uniref:Uncharacterized protein n=1 Tax=Cercophora newfieldiana TaxID=92897 RepID=A0AA39YC48_9PEZI|nr:hypothetical protein B0T16DRAFT_457282 [Cercophora newfieldiana]
MVRLGGLHPNYFSHWLARLETPPDGAADGLSIEDGGDVKTPELWQAIESYIKTKEPHLASVSGARLMDSKSNFADGAILHCEMFREGRLADIKMMLYHQKYSNSIPPSKELVAERLAAKRDFQTHQPLRLPQSSGYVNARRGRSPKPIHVFTIESGRDGTQLFEQKMFAIRDRVPARALEIMRTFINALPRDLMFESVLIQKALKWIWITNADNKGIENFPRPVPLNFENILLGAWFVASHSYGIFHQEHWFAQAAINSPAIGNKRRGREQKACLMSKKA